MKLDKKQKLSTKEAANLMPDYISIICEKDLELSDWVELQEQINVLLNVLNKLHGK